MNILEVLDLDEVQNLVILGHAGTGKSTIAQYLCLLGSDRAKRKQSRIPFRVLIRYFMSEWARREKRGEKYSLTDYIEDYIEQILRYRCPDGFLKYILENKETIIIFDGLDEVAKASDRLKVKRQIKKLMSKFARPKYIGTSRIFGYADAPLDSEFFHVALEPVALDQVDLFIKRWYGAREPDPQKRKERIESFLDAIEKPSVKELAEVPLLLTIMALINEEGPLPRLRTELYDTIVTTYVKNRQKLEKVLWYDYNECRAVHEYLGYWIHSRNEGPDPLIEVDSKALKDSITGFMQKTRSVSQTECAKKVDEFISLARDRVGLIVEKRIGEFSFVLRPVQEFLAASHINRQSYGVENLWGYVGENLDKSYWHDVIRFLGGKVGENNTKGVTDFLRKMLSTNNISGLILAAEIASERIFLEGNMRSIIFDRCFDFISRGLNTSIDKVTPLIESIVYLLDSEVREHIIESMTKTTSRDPSMGMNLYFQLARHQWGRVLISDKLLDWVAENLCKSNHLSIPNRYIPMLCVFNGLIQSQNLDDFCRELTASILGGEQNTRTWLQAFLLAVLIKIDSVRDTIKRILVSLSSEEKLKFAKNLSGVGMLTQEIDEAFRQD